MPADRLPSPFPLVAPTHWVGRFMKTDEVAAVIDVVRSGETFEVGNLIGAAGALMTAAIAGATPQVTVLVTPTPGDARLAVDDLALFAPDLKAVYFPTPDEAGMAAQVDRSGFGRRVEVATSLVRGKRRMLIVTSAAALLEPVPTPETLARATRIVSRGEELDRDALMHELVEASFERLPLVERPGQFAVRGDIVDVFDATSERPVRIELFGDEVDSIRNFDVETQLSHGKRETVELALMSPDADSDRATILEIAPRDSLVIQRDADRIDDAVRRVFEHAVDEAPLRRAWDLVVERTRGRFSRLPADAGTDLPCGVIQARGRDLDGACATLESLGEDGSEVGIFFASEPERLRFFETARNEVDAVLAAKALTVRGVVSDGAISRGFRWRGSFAIVNHRELFDILVDRRARVKIEPTAGRPIDDFLDLEPGDHVVHLGHGIARFTGIEHLEKGGEVQEFLNLEFADEVQLYVPVSRADLVQKYIGGKGDAPRLSKMGGRSWGNRKKDVFRAVTDLAVDMLDSQAMRAKEEGYAHTPDTAWQHEFEAAFPFEETSDQLGAINAVKADMESARPMDRLICGDVGYGKTEVAMRAVFKAVMSGKQVAVLVPTTILAEQHATTFAERMSAWPVRIGCLSRFKTKSEQEKTIVGLVEGDVDVAIGTHRLLSKDISFKDIGLLVIDEEQRFGVAHKEKLRALKRTVDVLTLTATPIPRTLHMSLLGIRDISALTQPPTGRRSVETKVVRFEDGLVRDAITKELARGGQCFFVHNRVQTIDRVRKELERIVPEATSLVVHGQMHEREIEQNMGAFLRGDADVLIATTIIESGLDIRTANTIFIDQPDLYGLADMHQLRGRVGRYHDQAHAYLLIRPETVLTTEAEKRVRAIEEFDELGAGFKIAMRDLEIRGAGNLLGSEQSGHITAVGYDLYCRLLESAVKRLQKENVILPDEIAVNLDFEAYLPGGYVQGDRLKLDVYRRLGRVADNVEVDALAEELRDRFGRPPAPVVDLIDLARVRLIAQRHRFHSIGIVEQGLLLRPRARKDLERRLLASASEYRVVGGREVIIVLEEAPKRPSDVVLALRHALSEE